MSFDNLPSRIRTFLQEISDEELKAICTELNQVLRWFLDQGNSVFLHRLGILFPQTLSATQTYLWSDQLVLRTETTRVFQFEKCNELTSYHNEKFGKNTLCELSSLTSRIYPRLPLSLHIRWNESTFRSKLKYVLEFLRWEVVTKGFSKILDSVGTLYALHNRQGTTFEDWFAGSDLFLAPSNCEPLVVGPCKILPRPVLQVSTEILEAQYGPPIEEIKCNPSHELLSHKVGYRNGKGSREISNSITVLVFQSTIAKQNVYIYSTRNLHHQYGRSYEFVFQLIHEHTAPPRWPIKIFASISELTEQIRGNENIVISSPIPYTDNSSRPLQHLLITQYDKIKLAQCSDMGSFSYLNLVGISAGEARVASRYGANFLTELLRARGLAQVTRLERACLTRLSGLLLEERDNCININKSLNIPHALSA